MSFPRSILRRRKWEGEMEAELRQHVEAEALDLIAKGIAPEEARREAFRKFGGLDSVRERCRDKRGVPWLENLARDFQYAARGLAKNRGYAAVMILTLALGIGANTAIFKLLDAVRLRSLPVQRPQELVEVRMEGGNPGMGISDGDHAEMTYPLWQQLKDRREAFSEMFAWSASGLPLGRGGEMRDAICLFISGRGFSTLGVQPQRGRLFDEADDVPGKAPGVVIGHGFWQSEFGGREDVIGKTLVLGDQALEIIGVTPPGFFGLEIGKPFAVALPISARALWWPEALQRTDAWWLHVVGRLRPGWSAERAEKYVKTLSGPVLEATLPVGYNPAAIDRYRQFKLTAEPAANGSSRLRKDYEQPLWLLLGITGLVLLIACVNLANLSLARATSRARELAVRLALGATRGRILSQMLGESLLLAGMGAVCGALLAGVLSKAILSFLNTQVNPLSLDLNLDWRVFGFTALAGIVTCILFGLAPAIRSCRVEPMLAMRAGGRGVSGTREGLALQRGLAVLQVAVSVALLAGASLLCRSFWNLVTLDPGFQQKGVIVGYLAYPHLQMPVEAREPYQQRLLGELRALPEVESAATTTHVPLGGSSWTMGLKITPNLAPDTWAKVTWTSPGYFKALGAPLIKGRDFNSGDTAAGHKVAVVNETFVRRYLATVNPIGAVAETMAEPGYPEAAYQIIGVVRDTKYADLRGEIPPTLFAPAAQIPEARLNTAIIVRTSASAGAALAAVRKRLAAIDPRMMMQFRVMNEDVLERLARERLMAWLSGGFGAVALALVMVGLYGLLSYLSATRRNEFGIRLALGAQKRSILWLVVRQGFVLGCIGIGLGLAGAAAMTGYLKTLLFQVEPNDPLTFVGVAGLLLGVACFASWLPARRATRLDPMIALRAE